MNKPIKLHAWPAAMLLFAAAGSAQAGALDIVDMARDKLYELRTGRARAAAPQPAVGASDDWGSAPSKVQPAPSQDSRGQDERQRDDRQTAPRIRPSKVSEAPVRAVTEPQRIGRIKRMSAVGRADSDAAPVSCLSVNRVWEGAAALAQSGRETKAYNAYLSLLMTCTRADELEGTVWQAARNLGPAGVDALLEEPVMASSRLASANYQLRVQRMFLANKERDYPRALELARSVRETMLAQGGAGELEVAGWLEQQNRRPRDAETLFRAALKRQRDNDSARQGLVYALLAQKKVEAAQREAERYEGQGAEELLAEVYLAQAREALGQNQYDTALKLLDKAEKAGIDVDDSVVQTRAWALKGAGRSADAARLFAQLQAANPDDQNLRKGWLQSLASSRDTDKLQQLASAGNPLSEEASAVLAEVYKAQGRTVAAAKLTGEFAREQVASVAGVVAVRSKSGDKGEGRLTETTLPGLTVRIPAGESASVELEAKQLRLNDGVNSTTGSELRLRATTEVWGSEVTAGVGVSKVDSSIKPTFELAIKRHTASGQVEAAVSHEPVRDSVRSYSGVRMDVTETQPDGLKRVVNRIVGRVFDTNARLGGQLEVSEQQNLKLSWSLSAGSLQGEGTPNNGYVAASAGLNKDFSQEGFSWLSAGPYVAVASYERDENQFTASHGGYFSPKSDVGMGLALNVMTQEGNRSLYKATAKAGYVSRGLYYGNDAGLALEVDTAAAWLMGPNLILGAGVGLKTSPGYTDFGLRLGLTVPLEARGKLGAGDLAPYKSQP